VWGAASAKKRATGVKTFTDDSLPANASPCTYQITAVRAARGGAARGNPAQFTVNFGMGGVGGGGFAITSITPHTSESYGANLKMAA
jgi:hypothetical protein